MQDENISRNRARQWRDQAYNLARLAGDVHQCAYAAAGGREFEREVLQLCAATADKAAALAARAAKNARRAVHPHTMAGAGAADSAAADAAHAKQIAATLQALAF